MGWCPFNKCDSYESCLIVTDRINFMMIMVTFSSTNHMVYAWSATCILYISQKTTRTSNGMDIVHWTRNKELAIQVPVCFRFVSPLPLSHISFRLSHITFYFVTYFLFIWHIFPFHLIHISFSFDTSFLCLCFIFPLPLSHISSAFVSYFLCLCFIFHLPFSHISSALQPSPLPSLHLIRIIFLEINFFHFFKKRQELHPIQQEKTIARSVTTRTTHKQQQELDSSNNNKSWT